MSEGRIGRIPRKKKTLKIGVFQLIVILVGISLLIWGAFFGIGKLKELKIGKNKSGEMTQEQKNRFDGVKKEVEAREKIVKEIEKGTKKASDYDMLDARKFVSYLEKKGLINYADHDEYLGGRIRINGPHTIDINDYKEENGKIVKVTTERNALAGDEPAIIRTNLGLEDKDGNFIVHLDSEGKVKFDPFYINGSDPIVMALDRDDRDLTEKTKVTYNVEPKDWKAGNKYEVNYTVKNSKGKEAKFTLKVVVMNAANATNANAKPKR